MKFHHIGIACESIPTLLNKLKSMINIKNVSDIVYDEKQDADLCMLTLDDGTNIELISGNVVANMVKKRNYLYHTCYSVTNIDEYISKLVSDGAFLVSEPKEAILFNHNRVCFLMWDLGLIELVEEKEKYGIN